MNPSVDTTKIQQTILENDKQLNTKLKRYETFQINLNRRCNEHKI